MKKLIAIMMLVFVLGGMVFAADGYAPSVEKFRACRNRAGSGFYWVDSTSGSTWWADPGKTAWVKCGTPEGAKASPVGTYIPFENYSGSGIYVLNTATGEGWWTDGKGWKSLGKPVN
jgi:hypothetical protein